MYLALDQIYFDDEGAGPSTSSVWVTWPQGHWKVTYPAPNGVYIYDATIKFNVHWAFNSQKTFLRDGSHVNRRVCVGIIQCCDPSCNFIKRPPTKPVEVARMIAEKRCERSGCHGVLRHVKCSVVAEAVTYADGCTFSYEHFGIHSHIRPPQNHINPSKLQRVIQIVQAHPERTPVQLVTGTSADDDSVVKIDRPLANGGRLGYIRRDIFGSDRRRARGGDHTVDEIHSFYQKHSDFILYHDLAKLVIMILQTAYMAESMMKQVRTEDDCNGFLTDATYAFFGDPLKYLFMTITYSPLLHAWEPVFFAYSGGLTTEHYRQYFYRFFGSMSKHANPSKELADWCYTQVRYFILSCRLNLNSQLLHIIRFLISVRRKDRASLKPLPITTCVFVASHPKILRMPVTPSNALDFASVLKPLLKDVYITLSVPSI